MTDKYHLSAFADEYDDHFETQLKALNRFGIAYIELRFLNTMNVADLSSDEVRRAITLLKQHGIRASAIGSPLGKIALDGDLATHFETAKRVFATAEQVGAPYVRMFSFYPPTGKDIDNCADDVFENVGKLLDIAADFDVTLCHENEAGIYGESPTRCLELLTAFGGRLRQVFDMGNFVLDGYAPYPDAFSLLRDHIAYFHIKDALYAGAIVPPGKGEASIAAILNAYRSPDNTPTFITLEPHLQTFSGLNALVGKAFDNPYQFPNAKTAFETAVEAIRTILTEQITRKGC